MKIFKKIEEKRQSLFGRILSKKPKENAMSEISALLSSHEDDIFKLDKEDIRKITDKYGVDSYSDFLDVRMEIFRDYLVYCLSDKVISDEETKALSHLKRLLSLKDGDVNGMIESESNRLYSAAVKDVVADGKISDIEKAALAKSRASLLIKDTTAIQILNKESNAFFNDYFSEALSDQRVSDEEVSKINSIVDALGIEQPVVKGYSKQDYDRYRLYWNIENGELPTLDSPINLNKNETLHFLGRGAWKETRKQKIATNYGGVSGRIKIIKGFDFRLGSIAAKSVTVDTFKTIQEGRLFLTNKRLILMGASGNKSLRLTSILEVNLFSNGVDLQKATGKSPFIEMDANPEIFAMMLNRLISE